MRPCARIAGTWTSRRFVVLLRHVLVVNVQSTSVLGVVLLLRLKVPTVVAVSVAAFERDAFDFDCLCPETRGARLVRFGGHHLGGHAEGTFAIVLRLIGHTCLLGKRATSIVLCLRDER
jgi:hypothetical protein